MRGNLREVKKEYTKPEVVRIKLVVEEAILALCWSAGALDEYGDCQVVLAPCPAPT